ncbi:nucleotidyl transferase AbiEii/AbiGii toxin family protein [Desulfofustis limnaeus]|uniref:Nucleotidyltransferase n=1 Tax=Desulfofustis limnaeus TaxID=2740163 RepID=A0ABM7W9K9_9BACT|nr:nucleotidyl transferase AbiEii/AbiGii toxin family protein [Desulfofustis limnaeus]BDD87682.1 nucleotidyltransferase [Desulfofustis limnaeus]
MNLFNKLVSEALRTKSELAPLQTVVEKELLHHEILLALSREGLLHGLTFIGGTCLRACYGANRLSEDLDFTGGVEFSRESLVDLGKVLTHDMKNKYDLPVTVTEPKRAREGNVDTWKVKIHTRTDTRMMPIQRINIDICAVTSYDRHPAMLLHDYGVDLGTSGLILQVESREEILADKMIALALRPNRLKNRDLWDIVWLKQRGIALPTELIKKKLMDRDIAPSIFVEALHTRLDDLYRPQSPARFIQELRRFLTPKVVAETLENKDFWKYMVRVIHEEAQLTIQAVEKQREPGSNSR